MKILNLKIDGMHCDGCAGQFSTLLENESGVREADVSFAAGEGHIAYNAHAIAEERLIAVIKGAGFGVEKI